MTAHPPTKTELGQQELRLRKRTLGQRHRTMLLLVDGKRRREEVLSLAQQVGVTPAHFDELIHWGMVAGEPLAAVIEDLPLADRGTDEAPPATLAVAPAEVDPVAAGAPPESVPEPAPSAWSDPAAAVAEPMPEVAVPVVTVPDAVPSTPAAPPVAVEAAAEIPLAAEPAEVERLSIAPAPVAGPRPLPSRRVAPSRRSPRVGAVSLPREPAPLLPLDTPRAVVPVLSEPLVGELPVHIRPVVLDASGDVARPADDGDSDEDRLLGEVRGLLIGTLLVDAPVSSSLTALRVHRARDREQLVRLVWEVERSLARARRPREAQARLGRARELLGLGNTVVHEQTLPGYPGGD